MNGQAFPLWEIGQIAVPIRANMGPHTFRHRFWAARRAISDRCSAVSFLARAGPPFLPPRLPRARAAARTSSDGGSSSSPLAPAVERLWLCRGVFLDRLGTLGSLPGAEY